jgi:DNA-binding transcriptional LysR family regulator
LCASPDYLAKAGAPQQPGELTQHRIIAVTGGRPMLDRWRFRTTQGEQTVQVKPRLAVNTVQAALEAASRGWGIAPKSPRREQLRAHYRHLCIQN